MNYSEQTSSLLEFDKLIIQLESFFISDYGKEYFKSHLFSKEKSNIEKKYHLVNDFKFLKDNFSNFSIHSIFNLQSHIDKFHIENYFIDQESLLLLKQLVLNVKEIKSFFNEHSDRFELKNLTSFSNHLFYDSAILREIDLVIDENGVVKSSASKALKDIRDRKTSIYKEHDQAFAGALQRANSNGFLNEINESIRNGRRVLAVHAEKKRQVKGVILDESETGRIVFVEPMETMFINNEINEIDREEQKEIRLILIKLTQFLSKYGKLIIQFQEFMAEWDCIQAKCQFMIKLGCSIPVLSDRIELNNAFHPLLKFKNLSESKKVVPFRLNMEPNEKALMISGPNAGGKSVTMKTIGLIALMVKAAIPISAEGGSQFPFFNLIFGDLGDAQSLENELSTYSSKLKLWHFMISESNQNSLLLFDELGDGTDPSFGASMAQVVLESCLKNKATIIATTHYSELKKFGINSDQVIHANMLFDEKNLEPTFHFSVGMPGSSYTFHIARKQGFSKELIARAESLSDTDKLKFDKKLFILEKKEKELLQMKKSVESSELDVKKQMKDWNRLHLDLDLSRKKLKYEKLLSSQDEVQRKEKEIIAFKQELKQKLKDEELEIERKRMIELTKLNQEKANQLYKEIHQVDPNQILKIGDHVQYIQTQAVGIIEKLDRSKAIVIFDNIRSTIKKDELIFIPKEKTDLKKAGIRKIIPIDKIQLRELDLRGKYVYEAIPELEDFINKALMNNFYEVKIIHGVGKLKLEIIKILKSIKSIQSWEQGIKEQGGEGVTIVKF